MPKAKFNKISVSFQFRLASCEMFVCKIAKCVIMISTHRQDAAKLSLTNLKSKI